MNCTLCGIKIEKYDKSLNHLVIDETHSADICMDCIEKVVKWQQGIFARLYPTAAIKKRFGKN